jgi:hypothetical protein
VILVAGAVLQVVAEMQQPAGSWQLSDQVAPADRIGEYQGFFGTGVTVARTPAAAYPIGPAAHRAYGSRTPRKTADPVPAP